MRQCARNRRMAMIKDRDELVEMMAQYVSGCGMGSMWAKSNEVKKDAWRAAVARALDAMEAAGVVPVPVEATEGYDRSVGRIGFKTYQGEA